MVPGLAEALNKLGLTYCDIGYDLRAIDYLEQSLVICEDNADLHGQGEGEGVWGVRLVCAFGVLYAVCCHVAQY
eukprot:1343885-Rhodomonas_salina.1